MTSTADRLLDVAEVLVQRRGYHAFSYADLAKAVGIKTASIHYHFPTKEQLVLALVQRYRTRFSDRLAALLTEGLAPSARIDRYVEIFRETFADDGRICVCGSLAADALTLGDPITRELRGFFEENESWLRQTLEEVAEGGALRAGLSPKLAARAIVSSLEGSMLRARVSGSGDAIDEMATWFNAVLT